MFWVACVAVLFAARRYQDQPLPDFIGVLTIFALSFDLVSTAIQLVFGERPVVLCGSDVTRAIRTTGGFWAMGDGQPVSVALVTCPREARKSAEAPQVIDRLIDGR
jgi:hypothetical protein